MSDSIETVLRTDKKEVKALCQKVRALYVKERYDDCIVLIKEGMSRFPNAAEPQNLMGIIYEVLGNHRMAMKHFRAAVALDGTYAPARENLEVFGHLEETGDPVFEAPEGDGYGENPYVVRFDERGVGHVVRRTAK